MAEPRGPRSGRAGNAPTLGPDQGGNRSFRRTPPGRADHEGGHPALKGALAGRPRGAWLGRAASASPRDVGPDAKR